MALSPAFLEEVIARTSLTSLIGRAVKLTKAGTEQKGCCPFHNEKSASFYVNDDKAFYHCFGCAAHGNAINWLVNHDGLPFMDAVRQLAAAAGMDMPANNPREREERDRRAPLLDAMDRAARLYAGQRDARAPAAYLERRGVSRDLAQTFGLGFSPDGNWLGAQLRDVGEAALIEAGLRIQPDDGREPYDRFRGRLMFPIHDARGRVIAFGARILGKGEPKYLNSPDTPLFDKGRTLFNLHRAAPAARQSNRLLVVEGYMDVIGLARVGILDVVAPNGTAMTEAQLALAWRLSPAPVMMFDGDAAGTRAAVKAAVRALPGLQPGRTLRFAALPADQDPDEVATAGGAAAIDAVVERAIGLAELLWRHECQQGRLDEPEGRAGLKQRLVERCQSIEHGGVRAEYQAEFRRRFDETFSAPERPAQRDSRAPGTRKPFERRKAPERPPTDGTRSMARAGVVSQVHLALLAGLLRYPEAVSSNAEIILRLPLEGRYRTLVEALVDASIVGDLSIDTLSATLDAAGLGGAPAAIFGQVRLPFAFTYPERSDDGREALIDALHAEHMN